MGEKKILVQSSLYKYILHTSTNFFLFNFWLRYAYLKDNIQKNEFIFKKIFWTPPPYTGSIQKRAGGSKWAGWPFVRRIFWENKGLVNSFLTNSHSYICSTLVVLAHSNFGSVHRPCHYTWYIHIPREPVGTEGSLPPPPPVFGRSLDPIISTCAGGQIMPTT